MTKSHAKKLPRNEFVALMALMTSLLALAIDSMLPAFDRIGSDFKVDSPDEIQMIVAILFLGFGCGQIVFGPVSDAYGRKMPIYWGIGIFMIGSILSGFSTSFEMFLIGRFLQGFGGAAPRIVSLALVRDEYSGNAMAQITSLIMTIFILVPAIAPTLGQGILMFSGWRAIFIVLFVVSAIVMIWFGLRQHETLPKEKRNKLSLKQIVHGTKITFSFPITVACMITSGLLFGIFVGYLGATQAIFDKIFHVRDQFPMYFAILALSIGAASFFNSRVVMIFGMRKLILIAFFAMAVLANIFVIYLVGFQVGETPLWMFMIYMIFTFFCVGFLFGNLNAMAMEPLGHVAGIGSAILGFVQSTISVVVGVKLGHYFHDNIVPLVLSFGTISMICIAILMLVKRFQKSLTT